MSGRRTFAQPGLKVTKQIQIPWQHSGRTDKIASSVPDFRRPDKGNIRHRLADIIMLMVLGRASGHVARSKIIEFGRHNLNGFRKMGMLRNGVSSEATLCRVERGIDELSMAERMREFAQTYHARLLNDKAGMEIICVPALNRAGERRQHGHRRQDQDTHATVLIHGRAGAGAWTDRDPNIPHP